MLDWIIFGYGSVVFLMLIGGVVFTVKEMKRVGKYPEEYRPQQWFDGMSDDSSGEN